MAMLLQELDQGPAALPKGSELTLFNFRDGLLGKIWYKAKLESLSLLHVQGNPLDQEDLKAKVDMTRSAHPSKLPCLLIDPTHYSSGRSNACDCLPMGKCIAVLNACRASGSFSLVRH